jgi:DNA-directed RNA polymerase specialized sigma24 family protein
MSSAVSAEELAELAGVSASTVRKIANELLEVLKTDFESQGVKNSGADRL